MHKIRSFVAVCIIFLGCKQNLNRVAIVKWRYYCEVVYMVKMQSISCADDAQEGASFSTFLILSNHQKRLCFIRLIGIIIPKEWHVISKNVRLWKFVIWKKYGIPYISHGAFFRFVSALEWGSQIHVVDIKIWLLVVKFILSNQHNAKALEIT